MFSSVPAYRWIARLDPERPYPMCSDWSVSYLPAAALFQIWKQTLAAQTLAFFLMFCPFLSLNITSFSLLSLAISPRNHPSAQWRNNRSSPLLGRSDWCVFRYNWDMSDCPENGRWGVWNNWSKSERDSVVLGMLVATLFKAWSCGISPTLMHYISRKAESHSRTLI